MKSMKSVRKKGKEKIVFTFHPRKFSGIAELHSAVFSFLLNKEQPFRLCLGVSVGPTLRTQPERLFHEKTSRSRVQLGDPKGARPPKKGHDEIPGRSVEEPAKRLAVRDGGVCPCCIGGQPCRNGLAVVQAAFHAPAHKWDMNYKKKPPCTGHRGFLKRLFFT